ncbi:unnamed protein product [Closterium sp. NIES-54]
MECLACQQNPTSPSCYQQQQAPYQLRCCPACRCPTPLRRASHPSHLPYPISHLPSPISHLPSPISHLHYCPPAARETLRESIQAAFTYLRGFKTPKFGYLFGGFTHLRQSCEFICFIFCQLSSTLTASSSLSPEALSGFSSFQTGLSGTYFFKLPKFGFLFSTIFKTPKFGFCFFSRFHTSEASSTRTASSSPSVASPTSSSSPPTCSTSAPLLASSSSRRLLAAASTAAFPPAVTSPRCFGAAAA